MEEQKKERTSEEGWEGPWCSGKPDKYSAPSLACIDFSLFPFSVRCLRVLPVSSLAGTFPSFLSIRTSNFFAESSAALTQLISFLVSQLFSHICVHTCAVSQHARAHFQYLYKMCVCVLVLHVDDNMSIGVMCICMDGVARVTVFSFRYILCF